MPETTEKKEEKKVESKPKFKMAKGTFADKFKDDGYECGTLELNALHTWNKGDFSIVCEHPQSGKPTFVMIKPGMKVKTWKRVYYRFQHEYHKLTAFKDENGEVQSKKERGFMVSWTPDEA